MKILKNKRYVDILRMVNCSICNIEIDEENHIARPEL